jgi:hypothetical protein
VRASPELRIQSNEIASVKNEGSSAGDVCRSRGPFPAFGVSISHRIKFKWMGSSFVGFVNKENISF